MKSAGPDGVKADFIRDVVQQYRGLARDQLKEQFPLIGAEVPLAVQQHHIDKVIAGSLIALRRLHL
jgi:hypothetical protein